MGPEHYRKAELLVENAWAKGGPHADAYYIRTDSQRDAMLATAQVHATLALAAAAGSAGAAGPVATGPLERLHTRVQAAMAGARTAEDEAADAGRDGDALLNNARVDAFDWVLQRIDEELGR